MNLHIHALDSPKPAEHAITIVEGAHNCTARCTTCEWWFTSSRKEMIEVAIKAHVKGKPDA